MKKVIIIAFLMTVCAIYAYSQDSRPRLAVLPFSGGAAGEGDSVATFFSQEPDITKNFTVLPRTAALNAIFQERKFQMEGLTDADTIVSLGRMINADYVLSGNIRRLGDRNLIVATIIHVQSFELVAGNYRSFSDVSEVRTLRSEMSKEMIASTKKNISQLPRLAIIPFAPASGVSVDSHEADTLGQMLAIDILKQGKYVILPRTSSIQDALAEMKFQSQGHTSSEGVAAIGKAINADYVLSGLVIRLGQSKGLNAQIINVTDGSLLTGDDVEYNVISDAIFQMPRLSILLNYPPGNERNAQLRKLPSPRSTQPKPVKEPKVKEQSKPLISESTLKNARRSLLELSVFFPLSKTEGQNSAVGVAGGLYYSSIPFTAIGVEAKLLFITMGEDEYGASQRSTLFSASPEAGFVIPLGNTLRLFGNGLIELGSFGTGNKGILTDWATPGFNVGIDINFIYNISVKYQGIMIKDSEKSKLSQSMFIGLGMSIF